MDNVCNIRSEPATKVNVGIVGLGKMGILHLGILNTLNDVEVRGVADNQGYILTNFKKLVPSTINVYKDYKQMLSKEDLDLVYITTSTKLHTKIAIDCVENTNNFFVEKPLGLSAADCSPLLDAVARKPVINMVGYCKRFTDTFKKAKEIIDSNVLGELIYFNSFMYVSQLFLKGKGWRYKKESSGGGVLSTLATHLIDTLLWFFGDIDCVNGNTKSFYSTDVEDYVHSYMKFKNGLEGYLDTSWSVRNYRLAEMKIELHGKNGMLVVSDDYVKISIDKESTLTTYYKQDLNKGVEFELGGPEYTLENRYLIECVKNTSQASGNVFDGYKVQKVIDAIYGSASQKKTIEVIL